MGLVDLHSLLAEALSVRPRGPVLVFAHYLPAPLERFGGELTYFGPRVPEARLAAERLTLVLRPGGEELLTALETWASQPGPAASLVLLDADHAMPAIVRQINATSKRSNSETLFVLPGGLPTSLGIAGSAPTETWWAGEVWTLPRILRPAGRRFVAGAAALEPLGVVLARDFDPLPMEVAVRRSAVLHAQAATGSGLASLLSPLPAREVSRILGVRPVDVPPDRVRVIVDPASPDVKSSEVLDAETHWERPSPRLLMDLSGQADLSVLRNTQRMKQGVRIDHFTDAFLLGHDIFLVRPEIDSALRFYIRNTRPEISSNTLRDFATGTASGHVWNAPILPGNGGLYCERDTLDSAVRVDAPVYFATPDEHVNWGMWLLFNVPAARHYARYRADYPKFLCFAGLGWQRSLLRDLGVRDEEFVHQEEGVVYAAARMAVLRHTFRGMTLGPADTKVFDDVAEEFAREAGDAPVPKRIFVARGSSTRGLVNENELARALEGLGFVTLRPETLPFKSQVRVFRGAEAIVGLGGAAMFNTVFCRPGVKIVDIESGMGFVDSHANLFASRGADYGVIIGMQDASDPTFYHKRWSVDVGPTVDAVRAFLAS